MTIWSGVLSNGINDGTVTSAGVVDTTTAFKSLSFGDRALWRLDGVNVDQGAQILSASLKVVTQHVGGAEASLRAVAADDVAALTSDLGTAPLTASSVPPFTFGSGYNYGPHDVTALVQELVDRPGWVPGNAMAFVVERISPTLACRFIEGSVDYAAALTVEFEAGAPPGAQVSYLDFSTLGAQPSAKLFELEFITDAPPPVAGSGRVWTGDQWVSALPHQWTGDQWVPLQPYQWTGDQWVPLS